ncbi:MAG TPA: hypothetical protein VIL46_03560, partial [Gemmataceae bacterium]
HGPFFSRFFSGDKDPATELTKEVWSMAAGWAAGVRKPSVVYRNQAGKLLLLPGFSQLAAR